MKVISKQHISISSVYFANSNLAKKVKNNFFALKMILFMRNRPTVCSDFGF